MSSGALSFGPGDIAPTEPADKVAAALTRYRCVDATTDPEFDVAYRLLDAQFGPVNELERRDVLERWFHLGTLSPPDDPIQAHYHLLTVYDRDGRVAQHNPQAQRLLGAGALLLLEDVLQGWSLLPKEAVRDHWQLYLGVFLVLVVLFARRGLAGLLPGNKNE